MVLSWVQTFLKTHSVVNFTSAHCDKLYTFLKSRRCSGKRYKVDVTAHLSQCVSVHFPVCACMCTCVHTHLSAYVLECEYAYMCVWWWDLVIIDDFTQIIFLHWSSCSWAPPPPLISTTFKNPFYFLQFFGSMWAFSILLPLSSY